MQRQEWVFTCIHSTINNAYIEDPPTAAAAIIYRMCTPNNLPFATHFCFEHFCFTSHLQQLTTSHRINIYLSYLAVFILYGLKVQSLNFSGFHPLFPLQELEGLPLKAVDLLSMLKCLAF